MELSLSMHGPRQADDSRANATAGHGHHGFRRLAAGRGRACSRRIVALSRGAPGHRRRTGRYDQWAVRARQDVSDGLEGLTVGVRGGNHPLRRKGDVVLERQVDHAL